ncbi:MAG: polyphenol oxidase family protein [Treponema sp.]|nr:polyphenol oxidase family protein [Treponema sp.]
MINEIFATFTNEPFLRFNFFKDGKPLENSPFCGMSVRSAGSMRFRWNEQNLNRDAFLKGIARTITPVPVELIHSRLVYDVKEAGQTSGLQGDGIITTNKSLMPVVTVADCMPIYLYEPESGVFGIVHSGWKGTGIIEDAIKLAVKTYGCGMGQSSGGENAGGRGERVCGGEHVGENFCVILGPHIRNCCYIVNQERADYFASNFGSDCVTPLEDGGKCYCGGRGLAINWNNGSDGGKLYRLSLEKANLNVLKRCGVKEENIVVYKDCTCCEEWLGSNRRETALFQAEQTELEKKSAAREGHSLDIKKQPAPFTVQAAFIKYM